MKLFSHTQDKVTTEYLAVGGEQGKDYFLKIFNFQTNQSLIKKSIDKDRRVLAIEVSESTNQLIAGTFKGTLLVFQIPGFHMQ